MRKRTALLAAALLAGGLTPLALAPAAGAAPAKYADDFNGDGYRDYATFRREHSPGHPNKGGGVLITFGTAHGPGTKTQFVDQASPGVPGADETDDEFGSVRAAADFNGDGYGDLAVSAPHEDVGSHKDQGGVTILWGSRSGLDGGTTVPNKGPAGSYDDMGVDLATGDFNGDGKPDLAVLDDGNAYVYRGRIDRSGVHGSVSTLEREQGGFYATALIAGKVNGDGKTDLAIIGDVVNGTYISSDAWFVAGGKARLYPGKVLHLEPTTGLRGATGRGGDGVIADFDKDGYGDIAVGTGMYDGYRGRLSVWYGSASGPARSVRINQSTAGVADTPEPEDAFASSVSAGDANGDGYPDLAVGVYGEKVGGHPYAGGVHVLYGHKSGLSGSGSQWFTRSTAGVPGDPQEDDAFGDTVRLRDTDHDGKADLYVTGAYGSLLLKGSSDGITTSGAAAAPGDLIVGMLQ
ncbi:FG-GAP and VCBS repeat-containing protein [Streptomyces sp. NPDC001107]